MTLDVVTDGWFGQYAARLLRAKSAPAVPRSRSAPPRSTAAPAALESAGLVQGGPSAKPAGPCLPMHVTASKTSCGVSMR